MKKTAKIAALLLVLAIILSLAACSGESVVGKWKAVDLNYFIEFKDDGTYEITVQGSGDIANAPSQTGIYKTSGKTLSMSEDSSDGVFNDSKYVIQGNKLTIEDPNSGGKAEYELQ